MPIGDHQTYNQDNLEIIGNHNVVMGNNCTVIGNHNIVRGRNCDVIGNHNLVEGLNCRVTGNHNITDRSCTAMGNFNTRINGSAIPSTSSSNISISDRSQVHINNSVISNSRISQSFFGTIGQERFRFGEKELILTNIQVDQTQITNNVTTFSWGGKRLIYDNGQMLYNGDLVHIDRLLVQNSVTMAWPEFALCLEQLVQEHFEGEDQPTEDQAQACVVCLDNRKCVAMMPCGHVCLCIECANEYRSKNCPLCRQTVKKLNRIFL